MAEVKPATFTPPAAPVATSQQAAEQANRQAEKAAADRDAAKETASKRLDEESKARHDANVEAGKRQAAMKPTPTQRENDLAKLGLLGADGLEDDGSGPDPHALRTTAAVSADAASGYRTRDVTEKK